MHGTDVQNGGTENYTAFANLFLTFGQLRVLGAVYRYVKSV